MSAWTFTLELDFTVILRATLHHNGTRNLVDLSIANYVVGCPRKKHMDIDMLKICLVAKGYRQTYGVNFFKTFSLVDRMNNVCLLFFLLHALIGHCCQVVYKCLPS